MYSGVVQYHSSYSQTCLFGFYVMLVLGEENDDLFYFIVRISVRKELKPELYFYAQFLVKEIL